MRGIVVAALAAVVLSASPASAVFRGNTQSAGQNVGTATLTKVSNVSAAVTTCRRVTGPVDVTVSWTAQSQARNYRVERRTGNGAFSVVATVSANSYLDQVAFNTTYGYRITALAGSFTAPSPSDVATVTTPNLVCN